MTKMIRSFKAAEKPLKALKGPDHLTLEPAKRRLSLEIDPSSCLFGEGCRKMDLCVTALSKKAFYIIERVDYGSL